MEPTDVAKALILGKFAKELAEELYSGRSLNEINTFLARDLRVVSRDAQQRFVAVIGPGLGIDATSTNVFGTLTPTIDDVLNHTLKAGYALQVGFNYGLVNGDWRKAKALYSSELYALEKLVVEVEGKDASELGEARRATRMVVDHLLSYVNDVYVEFSGHKSFYIAVWLPDPIEKVRAGGVTLREFYRTMGVSLLGRVARRVRGLVDMQFINAVKLLRVPGYTHEETGKAAQYLDVDLKPAEFDPSIMDRAVVSPRFIASIVNRIILHNIEWQARRRPTRKRVKVGKLGEWDTVIKYMLNEGIKVNDGRVRFSYVLGNYCAAKRLSLDQCRELHSRLVEGASTREYQRYLEYGYQHPEYLPWPFVFFKGSEWYSVPDVEVFKDVYEALRGRIRRHVEAKHAPRPEAEGEPEPTHKPEVEPRQGGVEVKTGVEPRQSNVEVETGAKPSEDTEGPVVDMKEITDLAEGLLETEVPGNLTSRLEPIIEQMVGFIIEKGVVGKWELRDRFYNSVASIVGSNDAGQLIDVVIDALVVAMVWLGLLRDDNNILTVVGKASEAKPTQKPEPQASEPKQSEAKTEVVKPEVGVEHSSGQGASKPGGQASEVEANEAKPEVEPKPSEAPVVEIETNAPKTEVEGSSSGVNQEPNQEPHGAHASGGMNHDSPTQPEAKATINIGDFINYSEAPVAAVVIKQSIIHSEPVEAPVNIATVDRIARRLCNSEDCLTSARLAITFIINTVGKGPVRVSWLEDAFKSRHPIHYEVLRSESIDMWVILTQLRGLGIVVVGGIATPCGWHSRWVTGLVERLLEARGRVGLSELVRMVRESEPDLPDFEGGLTLSDHVALAVKYLEWRGAVKVEGEAVTLVK